LLCLLCLFVFFSCCCCLCLFCLLRVVSSAHVQACDLYTTPPHALS
jgi:hypothetical protein